MLEIRLYFYPSSGQLTAHYGGATICFTSEERGDAQDFLGDCSGYDATALDVGRFEMAHINGSHWSYWVANDDAKR